MSIRQGYVWRSFLTFHLPGPWGPWPRAVTSCPSCGRTAGLGLEPARGHCQGRRGRLIYPCLKVPTTRNFLIISAQGAFICQRVCFDSGLLPRRAAGLVSCAGRKRGKRDLKMGVKQHPQLPPSPTMHSLLVFIHAASVRTQFLAIIVCTKTLS